METIRIRPTTESDFDAIIEAAGGKRHTSIPIVEINRERTTTLRTNRHARTIPSAAGHHDFRPSHGSITLAFGSFRRRFS